MKKQMIVEFQERILSQIRQVEAPAEIQNSGYCLIRSLRKQLKRSRVAGEHIHTVRSIGYKSVP